MQNIQQQLRTAGWTVELLFSRDDYDGTSCSGGLEIYACSHPQKGTVKLHIDEFAGETFIHNNGYELSSREEKALFYR